MFIIRTQSQENMNPVIRTFCFDNEKDLDYAVTCLKQTTCKGFSASVDSPDAARGIIRDQWDRSRKGCSSLRHTLRSGPYRDHIYEVFGHQGECEESVKRTNDQINCWASKRADLFHVCGDLYRTVYTEPYTD